MADGFPRSRYDYRVFNAGPGIFFALLSIVKSNKIYVIF